MTGFLVFDIGCIECGEPSGIVGTYDDVTAAQEALDAAAEAQQADWSGQHVFQIYDLSTLRVVLP